jgi:hypothetical protein
MSEHLGSLLSEGPIVKEYARAVSKIADDHDLMEKMILKKNVKVLKGKKA